MSKLIPLSMWAARRYDPAPSSRTLRRWAANGSIFPAPKKNGRAYWVQESAQYIDTQDPNYIEEVAKALHESSAQQG